MATNPFAQFASYNTEADLAKRVAEPNDPNALQNELVASLSDKPKLSPAEQKMLDEHIEELKRQAAKYGQPANPFAQFAQAQPQGGNPFEQMAQAPQEPTGIQKHLRNAVGGIDAALTMGAQAIPYIGSGVAGAASLPFVGPDKAEEIRKHLLETGLGLGEVKPLTPEGAQITDMLGEGANMLTSGAARGIQGVAKQYVDAAAQANELNGRKDHGFTPELADKIGNAGNLATDLTLGGWGAFTPIPGAKGVHALGKRIEGALAPEAKPLKTLKDLPSETPSEVVWKKKELTAKQIEALEKKAPANIRERDPFLQLKQWQDAQRTLPTEDSAAFSRIAEDAANPVSAEARAKSAFAQSTLDNRQAAMEAEMKKRVTLEQGARDLNRPDAFADAIKSTDEHPMVAAAERRVAKAEENLIKAAERNPEHTARIERELQKLEEQADKTRVNVVKSQMDVKLARDEIAALEQQVKEARDARRPFNPRGQGGAINPAVFKEGFEKLKKLADGTWLRAFTDETGFHIHAIKDAHKVGHADWDVLDPHGTRWNILPSQETLLREGEKYKGIESFSTKVEPDHRGKGIASEIYRFASELGNDVYASDTRTQDGKDMWRGFEKNGLAKYDMIKRVKSPGNNQMGGIWMGESKGRKPAMTPEQIEAKQQAARVAQMIPAKLRALDEFRDITSKEEALTLAANAKDIPKDFGQKNLGSGVNFQAIMSNHPFLKYLRHISKSVRAAANMFSEKYITDNKKGLTPLWTKMTDAERVQTMKSIMEGDQGQKKLTSEQMDALGFNEHQKKFVETFYDANDALYKRGNEVRTQLGFDPIDYRTGHFPGIFNGSYKSLVMDADNKVVGVLTGDTKAQLKLAKKYFNDNYDNVKFVDQQRASLQGSNKRYYSDIFSGMTDVLRMLGENDPRFAEVQEIVNKAMRESNNKLFNFDVHQLQKKGVVGNAGNKPWLSDKQNAREAFEAAIRYFEEGTMHHELQVPLQDLRELTQTPEAANHPNAVEYMNKYMKKMTGDDLSPVGAALNTIIDAPFNLIPTVSWGKEGAGITAGIGVGGHVPLRIASGVKNNMSQYFMGWGNYMFTAAQLLQPAQTGLPFMQLVSGRLGLNPTHIAESMGKAGIHFNYGVIEKYLDKHMDRMDPAMRAAMRYAEDRGLMTFSEIENAYQGTQHAVSRAKDQMAEANMKFGEFYTRTPMFMAFVDMLHNKSDIPLDTAFPIAENLTQFAMIDYHQWERPMVYGRYGVVGQFAGGLTTFKHGYLSQQMKLGKEAIAPTKLLDTSGEFSAYKRQLTPFIASVILSTMIFQGITGTPFYGELDQAYGYLKEKLTGKYSSIREDFLKKLPEWLNTGMISNAMGLNLQGKFSAADMIPDDLATAMSPQLTAFGKIIGDAIEYAKLGDHVRARNLISDLTPNAWKGVPETAMRTPEEKQDGFVRNKEGLIVGDNPRKPEDWTKRAVTGLRPQSEAVEREVLWNDRKTDTRDRKRRKEIEDEYKKRIIGGATDDRPFQTLQQEYENRGGDPRELIEIAKKTYVEMQLTEKQRLQGIPNNIPSINRYQNYNR